MLGAALEVLDNTIVNVSLPHMQGSFSASVDEIAWVATSYLVANGIMIPMTGWISSRFGRKRPAANVRFAGGCHQRIGQGGDRLTIARLSTRFLDPR